MFIYIKDISIEGCQFLAPENSVIVGVKTARTAIEEEVEEDGEESDENTDASNESTDTKEDKAEATTEEKS